MFLFAAALLFLQEPTLVELETFLNQAYAEQAARNRKKALALYQKILEAPKPADSKALVKHASMFSQAQFQKARCLEAEAKPGEALAAYQASERSPTGSFCGNAVAESVAVTRMGQGRCLEALSRHEEAVAAYFKATEDPLNGVNSDAVWRIVDLYQAAGRVDSLKKILDRMDREYFSRLDEAAKKGKTGFDLTTPAFPFRRLIEVREAARLEHWTQLIQTLEASGPLQYWRRTHEPPEVVDAAHLLAARPEQAVPLLKARLEANPEFRSWIYYALGLCGTPDALKALKQRAEALGRLPWQEQELTELCYVLDLSAPGRAILAEFSSGGTDNVKYALERVYKKSVPLNFDSSGYPPIPKDLKLN